MVFVTFPITCFYMVEAMQQNANLQFLRHHCLLSPIFSRNSISHFLSIVNKNRQYSRRFPVLYRRFFRYLYRIIISVLLEIIPRHIPRDILPRRLFTAGSRRSGDAIPSQLTRNSIIDVICTGTQTCRRCGCSFVGEQWYIAADVHQIGRASCRERVFR